MATTKVAARAISNVDLWNAIRANYPQFASHTAEGTADLFTERGFGTITQAGMGVLNEFWQLAMPYYLNLVNISHARDRLEEAGVGEYYDVPYGEYIQRMAINSIKPVSPKYRDLKNGPGPDPFRVRKPTASNRFFRTNFDYQSWITIPDEWENRRIFISEYGMSEFLAGVFTGLENGYIIQKYLNKLEAINGAIHQPDLKPSQTVTVTLSENPTEEEIVQYLLDIKLTLTAMTIGPQTGAYNALGFESVQDTDRLKLLVRPGLKARTDLIVARNSYNRDTLNLPIDVVEVPHFGGLQPTDSAGAALFPVYDANGDQIGYNTVSDSDTVTVANDDVVWVDPNSKVTAVLMDKGAIFETRKTPYQVEPIRNPYGLYTNYFASSPNNGINYDPLYNLVIFATA